MSKRFYKSGQESYGGIQEGRDMTFERYRLVLTHEYIDKKGVAHKLENPICTDYNIMLDGNNPPPAVIINEMLGRLRRFVLDGMKQPKEE